MLEKKDTEVFTEKYWTVNFMWKVQNTFVISSSFKRERKEPDSY